MVRKMRGHLVFLLVLSALVCSCAMLKPGLVGQESFASQAREMPVAGRYGWTSKRDIAFGPFYTTKLYEGDRQVTMADPDGRRVSFFEDSQANSYQRIYFRQHDSSGNVITVRCAALRKEKIVRYGKSITSTEVSQDDFEVSLSAPGLDATILFSKSGPARIVLESDTVLITSEYKVDRKEKTIFEGVLFRRAGEIIAAVNLSSHGTVWMEKGLDERSSIILAALATALILRPQM